MIDTCLSERPQGRKSAKKLLQSFPASAGVPRSTGRPSVDFSAHPVNRLLESGTTSTTHRSDKEYIDPQFAVTLDEVRRRRNTGASDFTSGQVTYMDPDSNAASTTYPFESSDSWMMGGGRRRGRSPVSSRHYRRSPEAFGRPASSATSLTSESPARCPTRGNSCDSGDEKEHTVPLRYPPRIEASDLKASSAAVRVPTPLLQDERTTSPAAAEADEPFVRAWEDRQIITRLLHTDSGFDEQMVEELELRETDNDATKTRKLERDHMPVIDELPTPRSFHTVASAPSVGESGGGADA